VNVGTVLPVLGRVPRETPLPPVLRTSSFFQVDRRLCGGGFRRMRSGCVVLYCNLIRG